MRRAQMMEPYLFYGIVLPERAPLTLQFTVRFSHLTSGISGQAKVSILLNQVAVWVESEQNWDIWDLRNVVKTVVQNHLAMVGYIKGYAYDLEVTRVLNQSRGIDQVFGIDIPCLAKRGGSRSISITRCRSFMRRLSVQMVYSCIVALATSPPP